MFLFLAIFLRVSNKSYLRTLSDLAYATLWINSSIIIASFCQDYELDIHENWLKDGVQWEYGQKMDLEEGEKGGEKRMSQRRGTGDLISQFL